MPSYGLDFCQSLNSDFYCAWLHFQACFFYVVTLRNYRITVPRNPIRGKYS